MTAILAFLPVVRPSVLSLRDSVTGRWYVIRYVITGRTMASVPTQQPGEPVAAEGLELVRAVAGGDVVRHRPAALRGERDAEPKRSFCRSGTGCCLGGSRTFAGYRLLNFTVRIPAVVALTAPLGGSEANGLPLMPMLTTTLDSDG